MIRYLSKEEVIELHRRGLERFGGMPGLRDEGLLDSALAQPQAAFGGQELHPTLAAKAAALAFSLINNHAFVDGNKRVGFASMAVFLELNSMKLICSPDEGENTVLAVASGTMDSEHLASWIDSKLTKF
jgi:death-on-curing protein